MALLFELMSNVIVLAAKPFSLFKLSCFFGVRSLCVVIQTWIELLKAAIYLHLILIWRLIIWSIAILSLPMQLLTALQREKQLEIHLHEMQSELEILAWDRKELRKQLQATVKEHKMMELMLAELEDEHDEAIAKIELLEDELQDLKDENQRLKEVRCNSTMDDRGQGEDNSVFKDAGDYCTSPRKHSYDGSGVTGHEIKLKDVWVDEDRHESIMRDVIHIVDQSWKIALCRSLFSATLSLLVGMIVWEAEDPCMPLVIALFTVVGLSLKSVVEFFSTIKNKPASDAVALLSLNWFILGTLTYPILPRVACMLAPLALRMSERALRLFGLSFVE